MNIARGIANLLTNNVFGRKSKKTTTTKENIEHKTFAGAWN